MSAPLITRLDDLPDALRGASVAIGNFDGVHRGHRAVLERAMAVSSDAPAIALTFEPHPRDAFGRGPVFRLTPEAMKAKEIKRLGLDAVVSLPFPALAAMPAPAFVQAVLAEGLGARHVLTGADFRFGAKRSGDAPLLTALGETHGFDAHVVPPVLIDGAPVSSSRIRTALKAGEIETATRLLGRPWNFSGTVQKGAQLGRTLGYPTANIALPASVTLAHSVYAVTAEVDGASHSGVASFGRRPTFDNGAALFETFLFGFEGDLYGREMTVTLHAFLRPELKFDSADALVVQMDQDAAAAREALARLSPAGAA